MVKGKNELDYMFEEVVDGSEPDGHVGNERAVIANAAEEGTELFDVGRQWHSGGDGDLVGVRANASGGNSLSQKSALVAPGLDLAGERFRLCLRRRYNRARMLSTWEVGSGSNTMTLSS